VNTGLIDVEIEVDSGAMRRGAVRGEPEADPGVGGVGVDVEVGVDVGVEVGVDVGVDVDADVGFEVDVGVDVGTLRSDPGPGPSGVDWPQPVSAPNEIITAIPSVCRPLPIVRAPFQQSGT
jgi:hypothetical protein